jgi:hypothetical protein
MHSKLASDWELFDAAQAEEQEMNDSSGLCSHGMPTRLPHCGGRSMDLKPGGQQSSCATRSDPCLCACMRKHQSRGWNR